jgi:hypothetical protein
VTAGNQPTSQQQINAQVTAMCVDLRNDFQDIVNFYTWLNAVGGATFLENMPQPFDSADAAVIVSTVGNLAALAAIYAGGAASQTFNYEANTEILWSGQ